ncbi:MAG: two-component system, response regulator PdtaR [Solirubrobacteraceae bacterium]|jgi:response regulator NasT|nr:two-component system, response regulator PdtaR [Solirubrobacteraceae bacterium]
MAETPKQDGLRVFAADEDERTLRETAQLMTELGHTVTASTTRVSEAGDEIAREDPDLSIVVVDEDDEHALDLIEEICEYARGPIIVLVARHEADFITRAAERGIFAFARPHFRDEVQGAIELAMKRHEERVRLTQQVEQLESALERRGTIERAKGILMERHGLDDRGAFAMLREKARSSNRRVVDLAHAVTDGHALLPKTGD